MALTTAPISARPPGSDAEPPPAVDELELWQEAQDRVLLYLKQLGMPPVLSLEIARETLRQAADGAQEPGSERPIVRAMRVLHMLFQRDASLLEDTPYARYRVLYRRWQPPDPASPASGSPAAWPPIKRGAMAIRKI